MSGLPQSLLLRSDPFEINAAHPRISGKMTRTQHHFSRVFQAMSLTAFLISKENKKFRKSVLALTTAAATLGTTVFAALPENTIANLLKQGNKDQLCKAPQFWSTWTTMSWRTMTQSKLAKSKRHSCHHTLMTICSFTP
jgi:hypothetical protein